ncbi:MAG: hypothetical protein OEL53_18420 [Rhodospirillales bacterium]|nr:hypothetical protein [Rhodospirillales bacterium]
MAALFGPDFSQNPFSPTQILQRLLTSFRRYGFSIAWKFKRLHGAKLLTFSQRWTGAKSACVRNYEALTVPGIANVDSTLRISKRTNAAEELDFDIMGRKDRVARIDEAPIITTLKWVA